MDPEEARELHAQFKLELDRHIGGYDADDYKSLMTRMQAKLSPKEKSKAKDIMDIVDTLQKKGTIAVGNYEYLKSIFKESDLPVVGNIIVPFEKKIQEILNKEGNMPESKVGYVAQSLPTEKHIQLSYAEEMKQKETPSQKGLIADDSKEPIVNTYDMRPKQKGFLLILNVISEERKGSEKDVQNLRDFFGKQLDFTVVDYNDLTLAEVDDILLRAKNTLTGIESHMYYCFVCVIMSHGGKDGILTTDGKFFKMDTVVDKFKNTVFKEFIGKPKVFLVQACRGESIQELVAHDSELEEDIRGISALKDADILIAYSTTDGHVSLRNTMHGSWFINSLLHVFKQLYTRHHFEEMLVSVRYMLAWDDDYRKDPTEAHVSQQILCQMPCTWTTLTKLFLLKAARNM